MTLAPGNLIFLSFIFQCIPLSKMKVIYLSIGGQRERAGARTGLEMLCEGQSEEGCCVSGKGRERNKGDFSATRTWRFPDIIAASCSFGL